MVGRSVGALGMQQKPDEFSAVLVRIASCDHFWRLADVISTIIFFTCSGVTLPCCCVTQFEITGMVDGAGGADAAAAGLTSPSAARLVPFAANAFCWPRKNLSSRQGQCSWSSSCPRSSPCRCCIRHTPRRVRGSSL